MIIAPFIADQHTVRRPFIGRLILLMQLLLIPASFPLTQARPGEVDPNFDPGLGTDGPVNSIVIQNDGKIIIAGQFASVDGSTRYNIARMNEDGSLDISYAPTVFDPVASALLQPDGKLLIATSQLFRLNPDGTQDTTFQLLNFGCRSQQPFALLPDGRIVAAAPAGLTRLKPDGTADSTFHLSPDLSFLCMDIAVQPDLKIIARGFVSLGAGAGAILTERLDPDGRRDSSFTAEGFGTTLAFQENGRMLISAGPAGRFQRLMPDGALDTGFGTELGFRETIDQINTAVIQADGKIVVGGRFATVQGQPAKNLVRLLTDGSIDSTFNVGSGVAGPVSVNRVPEVRALAIDVGGNILVGGQFASVGGVARNNICRMRAGEMSFSAPTIKKQPVDQSIPEGQQVLLAVSDVGYPYPSYQWFHNGTEVPAATNSVFKITRGEVTDAGEYYVTLRNSLGTVISHAATIGVSTIRVSTYTQPGSLDFSFTPPDSHPYSSKLVGQLRNGDIIFQQAVQPSWELRLIRLGRDGEIKTVWPVRLWSNIPRDGGGDFNTGTS